jgi:hypothetical protein
MNHQTVSDCAFAAVESYRTDFVRLALRETAFKSERINNRIVQIYFTGNNNLEGFVSIQYEFQ